MNSEFQEDSSVSSSESDELSSKLCIEQTSLMPSSEEDTIACVSIPITIDSSTAESNEVKRTEDLNVEMHKPAEKSTVQKEMTCTDKTPENTSNAEEERSASSLSINSHKSSESSDLEPTNRPKRTVSFTIEAVTQVKEASLEIEPEEAVVSSCSTSPRELLENFEDAVIINPATKQVSYIPTRKRAKAGLNSIIMKSANSAVMKSVMINAIAEEAKDLDDSTDNENKLPVSHLSTFNRYRNTFSWKRGRSVTRQSFVGKSQDNFLAFHEIGYTVQQKKFFRAIGSKVILKNIRYV